MAKANVADAKKALSKSGNKSIQELINESAKELGRALPSHMSPERMCRIALTTLRLNPKLMNCDPKSILGALFQSAALGLEPNVEGQAYIVPYSNEAVFQIGYKGIIDLFYRHESSLSIDAHTVHENDDFSYTYGTESKLEHQPALSNRGKAIAYYAVAKMRDGASVFKVMSKEDCEQHGKKHSKTYGNGPWKTDFDAMAKKTVLLQLAKLLPKSVEIQHALSMDNTIKTRVSADMFDIPDETEWKDVEVEDVTEEEKPKSNIQKKAEEYKKEKDAQKQAEDFFGDDEEGTEAEVDEDGNFI